MSENTSPYDDDEYAEMVAVWNGLGGAARETLRGLVLAGPLWDGNVPSKSGRDELLRKGLASKAVVKRQQGYQVANYKGWGVYRCAHPEEFEAPDRIAAKAIRAAMRPK